MRSVREGNRNSGAGAALKPRDACTYPYTTRISRASPRVGSLRFPHNMSNPTTCTQCGASVVVRDGTAYTPDTMGTLHGCLAPEPDVPQAEGIAMVLNDQGELEPWILDSLEYAAFEKQCADQAVGQA